MQETGKVIKIENGSAVIRFERKSECDKCRMCAFSDKEKHFDVTVKNTLNAKEGDAVQVDMAGGLVMLSSLIVYAVPLAAAAAGLFAGYFAGGENLAVILSLIFLAGGFFAVNLIYGHINKKSKKFSPQMARIMEKEDTENI